VLKSNKINLTDQEVTEHVTNQNYDDVNAFGHIKYGLK